MSCLQDPSLGKDHPRKDAGLLWDLDLEQQLLFVRLRTDVPFEPSAGKIALVESQRSLVESMNLESSVFIGGKVARQYSPLIKRDLEVEEFFKNLKSPVPKRPRSRLQTVRAANLETWIREKLERLGLNVFQIFALPAPDIRLSSTRRIESVPAAVFRAHISGSPEAIEMLIDSGLGRAKNYGLGLIHITQNQ